MYKITNFFKPTTSLCRKSSETSLETEVSYSQLTPLPVVFIHGLGIGFGSYVGIISSFPYEVDVILVEWHHVSMQLHHKVPSIDDTTRSIISTMDDLHIPQACFLAHSLGNNALSWILKNKETSHRVGATIMLDPITFLLCDNKVATSVIYHEPHSSVEFLLHYFVSRELNIAYTISRHFEWSQNIVFFEDLPGCRTLKTPPSGMDNDHNVSVPAKSKARVQNTIILSSADGIVPSSAIERYLKAKYKEGHTNVEHFVSEGPHGHMMFSYCSIVEIKNKLRERCHLEKM